MTEIQSALNRKNIKNKKIKLFKKLGLQQITGRLHVLQGSWVYLVELSCNQWKVLIMDNKAICANCKYKMLKTSKMCDNFNDPSSREGKNEYVQFKRNWTLLNLECAGPKKTKKLTSKITNTNLIGAFLTKRKQSNPM